VDSISWLQNNYKYNSIAGSQKGAEYLYNVPPPPPPLKDHDKLGSTLKEKKSDKQGKGKK